MTGVLALLWLAMVIPAFLLMMRMGLFGIVVPVGMLYAAFSFGLIHP